MKKILFLTLFIALNYSFSLNYISIDNNPEIDVRIKNVDNFISLTKEMNIKNIFSNSTYFILINDSLKYGIRRNGYSSLIDLQDGTKKAFSSGTAYYEAKKLNIQSSEIYRYYKSNSFQNVSDAKEAFSLGYTNTNRYEYYGKYSLPVMTKHENIKHLLSFKNKIFYENYINFDSMSDFDRLFVKNSNYYLTIRLAKAIIVHDETRNYTRYRGKSVKTNIFKKYPYLKQMLNNHVFTNIFSTSIPFDEIKNSNFFTISNKNISVVNFSEKDIIDFYNICLGRRFNPPSENYFKNYFNQRDYNRTRYNSTIFDNIKVGIKTNSDYFYLAKVYGNNNLDEFQKTLQVRRDNFYSLKQHNQAIKIIENKFYIADDDYRKIFEWDVKRYIDMVRRESGVSDVVYNFYRTYLTSGFADYKGFLPAFKIGLPSYPQYNDYLKFKSHIGTNVKKSKRNFYVFFLKNLKKGIYNRDMLSQKYSQFYQKNDFVNIYYREYDSIKQSTIHTNREGDSYTTFNVTTIKRRKNDNKSGKTQITNFFEPPFISSIDIPTPIGKYDQESQVFIKY